VLDAAAAAALVAERIVSLPQCDAPVFVGLNGAQGAGKSTLARLIAADLESRGLRCALLSLDDFYMTKVERVELACTVHPMCGTRGVPGTHDVALLEATLAAFADGGETALPRFDKLSDDRLPRDEWAVFGGRPDVILLEGWCVGICSTDLPAWAGAINNLEAECDPDGTWFAWSRAALKCHYDKLWRRFDLLVSIEVPGWETVIDSRLRQEQEAMAATGRPGMDRAQVTRFAEHYERYTRALWAAMPKRADVLLHRDDEFGYGMAENREG